MSIVNGKFCPKCKQSLVYSGNYYCIGVDNGTCDWAMSERRSAFNDDIIKTYLLQCRALAISEGDDEKVWRMDFYLIEYADGPAT